MADKGDNLGSGLPQGLFDTIVGQLSGGAPKGSPVEQAAVFLALTREENAALHPGDGTTSMVDAMLKYADIAQAAKELVAAANAGQTTAAVNQPTPAIQALG